MMAPDRPKHKILETLHLSTGLFASNPTHRHLTIGRSELSQVIKPLRVHTPAPSNQVQVNHGPAAETVKEGASHHYGPIEIY